MQRVVFKGKSSATGFTFGGIALALRSKFSWRIQQTFEINLHVKDVERLKLNDFGVGNV